MKPAVACLFGVAVGIAIFTAFAMKLGKKHKGAEYPQSGSTH